MRDLITLPLFISWLGALIWAVVVVEEWLNKKKGD